jgi:hypothetical protein
MQIAIMVATRSRHFPDPAPCPPRCLGVQHDAWQSERLKVRQLEGYLEQISAEVHTRAVALERERADKDGLEQTLTALQVGAGQGALCACLSPYCDIHWCTACCL